MDEPLTSQCYSAIPCSNLELFKDETHQSLHSQFIIEINNCNSYKYSSSLVILQNSNMKLKAC
jgi:hypothetical protein